MIANYIVINNLLYKQLQYIRCLYILKTKIHIRVIFKNFIEKGYNFWNR
jgi:hypothetical protein